jgi:hypothetical protein
MYLDILTPVFNMSVNSTDFDFGRGEGFHTASSDCCRSGLPGGRGLIATKRLLDTLIGAGLSGGSRGFCGHRAFAILLKQRY